MTKLSVAIAGKKDTVLLPLADLNCTFFVRKQLDEERVLYFMGLYEAGGDVPPIEVVRGTMEVKDGRHRKAALEHLDRQHAECILTESQDKAELIIDAYGRNFGGPLPPTHADTVFVIRQLIENGAPNKQVTDGFARFYPRSIVRKFVSEAHTEIGRAKLAKAVHAVAHGDSTVNAAASEFGVDIERLQDEIKGVRSKRRKRSAGIPQIKADISNRYRGNTGRTAAVLRSLLDKYGDGEIEEGKVVEVFDHLENLLKQGRLSLREWRKRFETLQGQAKAK